MKVILDSHQHPFSERYKALLGKAGVEVIDFVPARRERDAMLPYINHLARHRVRRVHFIWAHYHPSILLIPRLLGKMVILHWIGTDVLQAVKQPDIKWKWLGSRHIVMDQCLARELEPLGIKASQVRAPLKFPDKVNKWPTGDKVFTYIPKGREALYGAEKVLSLAGDYPSVQFLVAAHDGEQMPELPNVSYVGWLNSDEMEQAWDECRVCLRLTQHDSGGGTAMEALARQRYVVWTRPYPFCNHANGYGQTKEHLEWCLSQDKPNNGAREYVMADFDPNKIVADLLEVYK